ncbi:hypothetical protein PIB30_094236 [Stylosanthes scabra]|uniref:Uncharacterized protein n=1 Tax=Stylosanthes scabra TaxID=79078 RepID=A0ABU6XUH6_9FABA|nr:hypothetical protein [Stylosanthes scabra]
MKELRLLCGEGEGDNTLIEAMKTKELCQLSGFSFKSNEDDELLATIARRKTLKNLKTGTGLKKLTPETPVKNQKPSKPGACTPSKKQKPLKPAASTPTKKQKQAKAVSNLGGRNFSTKLLIFFPFKILNLGAVRIDLEIKLLLI